MAATPNEASTVVNLPTPEAVSKLVRKIWSARPGKPLTRRFRQHFGGAFMRRWSELTRHA